MKLRRTKRAAVLGCGPAGLFATHALVQKGWDVTIFSKRRRSELYGAQYLHAPIPGLSVEKAQVSYRLTGTVEGYREKVYGPNRVAASVETLEPSHDAWDIREAYFQAWDLYFPLIREMEISPEALGVVRYDPAGPPIVPRPAIEIGAFDRVVNSIPRPALCYQKSAHQFHSIGVWAIGDAPERGTFAPFRAAPFTIDCDGTRDVGWYRSSNVFGYATVEWPAKSKPPIPHVAEVVKPISTDCDCFSDFLHVGRYGKWTKGVLSHHAYTEASWL